MNYDRLADNLRYYRIAAGMRTQGELAAKSGINVKVISSLECGWRTKSIRVETAELIARACGVSLLDLLDTSVDLLRSGAVAANAKRRTVIDHTATDADLDTAALKMLGR